MALEVLIGHSTYHNYVGHGFLWQVDPFRHLQTAVIGFFVLSGYVICYVSQEKEFTWVDYTSARFARLYSVVIPALILTLVVDFLGKSISPDFYKQWDFPECFIGNQFVGYLSSLFFLNDSPFVGAVSPGSNVPFWSMPFEASYYVMFGALIFARGKWKIIVISLVTVISGLKVLILFPAWCFGVFAYLLQKRMRPPTAVSAIIFIASFIAIVPISNMRPGVASAISGRDTFLDYAEGFIVAANIYSAAGLERMLANLLGGMERAIRFLGSLTFPLYLCHWPLLILFSIIRIGAPETLLQKIWLFGMIGVVVTLFTYIAEWGRKRLKRFAAVKLKRLGQRVSPVPEAPV